MAEDLGARPWYGDWPVGVPKTIEIPNISLGDLLRDTARRLPDNKAIIFLDSVLTYRQLDELVDRLATAFHGLGLKKGDVVAMMLPNSHQFVVTYYACQRLGLVTTAINPTYKPLEIKHQLNDSGAKAFVVLDSVYAAADKVMGQTQVKHLIGTNIVDLAGLSPIKKFLGKLLKKIPTGEMPANAIKFTDLVKTAPNVPQVEVDAANDLAVLQYTGGTTGTPKGGMLTARNLVSNSLMGKAWVGEDLPNNSGYVGVLPLFHVFAMTCVMNIAVATGGFQLLFPRPPESMLEWAAQIQKWGQGCQMVMPGVAVLFNKINHTEGLEKFNLSPLIKCMSGAGPLPREVQLAFEKKTGALVVEGYGLTESSPVVTANPFTLPEGKERVMGSIGIPFPNTDCKIMDLETGEKEMPLGPEGVGELCVKGPQVMKGYFNRPDETARTIRDGWLYTGDIAYMDERGWIFIMDRAKDLVKHKGYSVFPKEVEDYLFSHPDILEVAVVGLPNPKVGEILKAFVVLKPDSVGKVSEQDIIAWCQENMTHYKVPSVVEFRQDLPKTMVGKVLRRVLKDEEMAKAKQA
ncbi:MAG: long-chain fatty acid--CoA ligase [Desulfarculus sp.]|nr:long-chain fatty acid--CoA ligase [Desulfarculus sp.]